MTTPPAAPLVAITIKTFDRPHRLTVTIRSIAEHCRVPYRLYIADDGAPSSELEAVYAGLRLGGHVVVRHPGWTSVTAARNDLVSRLRDEAYVLRLDDDFNFTAETDLGAMLRILAARPEIGALAGIERQQGDGKGTASGAVSTKQGHLFIDNGVLLRTNVPAEAWTYLEAAGQRFAYANFTRNFLLIRRAVFDTVRWDEDLLIQGEHLAFQLDLQRAGWLLAFTPDSVHVHDEVGDDPAGDYGARRYSELGLERQREVFRRRFGIVSQGREVLVSSAGRSRRAGRGVMAMALARCRSLLSQPGRSGA